MLLIPRVLDCLPQRIDHKSLLLALHMAAEAANPYFRLGYNSLGAFATINHLHFQVYPIFDPSITLFPLAYLKMTCSDRFCGGLLGNRHITWPCLSL